MRTKFILLLLLCVGAVEAQIRFKPVDKTEYEIWGKEILPTYFRDNTQCKCQFIVSPSFFPSHALYISDYTNENSQTFAYNYTNILAAKDGKGEMHKMESDSVSVIKLYSLMKHVLNTSMYCYERMGFDGTRYFIFDGFNGATCWSPIDNDRIVVNTLENIYKAVVNGNQAEIDAQMPRIDSLTVVYKKLYPDDFFSFEESTGSITNNGKTKHYVRFSTLNDELEFMFVIPKSGYSKGKYMPDVYKEKYLNILKNVWRSLFIETSLFDIHGYLQFSIGDKAPIEEKDIILTKDDLTEERLKEIIVKEISKRK